MGLYKLKFEDGKIDSGLLEKAKTDTIDYEAHFENWLENSPSVLLDDDENTLLWIGRQISASVGDEGRYPDLIGIDSSGNLVVVELKKGKTPRDVIAQILEYASWGASLSYDQLNEIACGYFRKKDEDSDKTLSQIFKDVFYPDSEEELNIEFNTQQKLFIVAEEISSVIRQVAGYIRSKYQVDIHCIEYEVLKSPQGEFLISTEKIIGYDGTTVSKISPGNHLPRWDKPVKVKTVVYEAVKNITKGDHSVLFSPAEVYAKIIEQYPDMKRNTVGCQIIQDCVNHSSRRHYPGGQKDYYFLVDKGKYRLYDQSIDGEWNWRGEKMKQ